jgi:hypothetical protein
MGAQRATRRVGPAITGVLLVLIAACSNDGGQMFGSFDTSEETIGDSNAVDDTGEETADTTDAPSDDDVERPDIPPVDCNTVMHTEDVEVALDVWNRPADERGTFRYSRGEVCEERIAADERVYVRLEPGTPGDFSDDAELVGATGESVDGVGTAARWFDGSDEGGLAVHQTTTLGQLYFRILLRRPELDGDGRLAVATKLAHIMLPRFPGVERPAPKVVVYQPDPPDRSHEGYVELLAAREASGDWTRAEGVIALLEVLAGDVDAGQVLGDVELMAGSGTALVGSASEVLDDSDTDTTDRQAIQRLLDRIVVSRSRLEAMATPTATTTTTTTTTTAAGATTTTAAGATTTTSAVQPLMAPRRQGASDCEAMYGTPPPCLIIISVPELDATYGDGKYQLYAPIGADSKPVGWTDTQLGWLTEALTDSAKIFESIGVMPKVDVVVTTDDGPTPTLSDPAIDFCSVIARTPLQQYVEPQFKQWIAGEMAHCFNAATFTEQYSGGYNGGSWWAAGTAIYLSNVVYPDANLEWVALPSTLAAHELGTSIGQRGPTNGMYFQDLSYQYGLGGLVGLIRQLPKDTSGQLDRLAHEPGIDAAYQHYVEQLSDLGVPDSGEDPLEGFYEPLVRDFAIDAPASTQSNVNRFRVDRIRAVVGGGQYACMSYDRTGDARLSWRTGNIGETGSWSEDVPDVIDGTSLFAASSVSDGGSVTMTAEDVVEDPSDCEFDVVDPDPSGNDCPVDCGPSNYYRP